MLADFNKDNYKNPDRKPIKHRANGPVGQQTPYANYNPFQGNEHYVPSGTGRAPITVDSPPTAPAPIRPTAPSPRGPGSGAYSAATSHVGNYLSARQRHPYRMGFKGLRPPIHDYALEFSAGGDFGPRVHPVNGGYSYHTGIDFSVGMGTPIYAPNGGIVSTAAPDSIYGNQLILDHGHDLQTMYGHLSQFNVQPGDKVKRGQVIGFVGTTGLSTGPHLHFETWNNGHPVNPMTFLGG